MARTTRATTQANVTRRLRVNYVENDVCPRANAELSQVNHDSYHTFEAVDQSTRETPLHGLTSVPIWVT